MGFELSHPSSAGIRLLVPPHNLAMGRELLADAWSGFAPLGPFSPDRSPGHSGIRLAAS
jgi:hypothetical protein